MEVDLNFLNRLPQLTVWLGFGMERNPFIIPVTLSQVLPVFLWILPRVSLCQCLYIVILAISKPRRRIRCDTFPTVFLLLHVPPPCASPSPSSPFQFSFLRCIVFRSERLRLLKRTRRPSSTARSRSGQGLGVREWRTPSPPPWARIRCRSGFCPLPRLGSHQLAATTRMASRRRHRYASPTHVCNTACFERITASVASISAVSHHLGSPVCITTFELLSLCCPSSRTDVRFLSTGHEVNVEERPKFDEASVPAACRPWLCGAHPSSAEEDVFQHCRRQHRCVKLSL